MSYPCDSYREYACLDGAGWPSGCGENVYSRLVTQYCPGNGSTCNGDFLEGDWMVWDSCNLDEACHTGETACSYTFGCCDKVIYIRGIGPFLSSDECERLSGSGSCTDNNYYNNALYVGDFFDTDDDLTELLWGTFPDISSDSVDWFYVDLHDGAGGPTAPDPYLESSGILGTDLLVEFHCFEGDAEIQEDWEGNCQVVNAGGSDFIRCQADYTYFEEIHFQPDCNLTLDESGRLFVKVIRDPRDCYYLYHVRGSF